MVVKDAAKDWWKDFFDETYLRFWVTLTPERVEREVAGIIKYLNLKPGQSILDAPCGNGRITVPMAKKTFNMTGIDISDFMLDSAKRECKKNNVNIELVKGDIRYLPFENRFDAVLGIFHPLGMFSEQEDDISMLKSMFKSLKKGGKLLLESRHRDALDCKKDADEYWEYDGTVILQSAKFDPISSIRKMSLKWLDNGEWKEKLSEGRYYTATEIVNMLTDVGFTIKEIYGDFEGGKFNMDKNNIVIVAEK